MPSSPAITGTAAVLAAVLAMPAPLHAETDVSVIRVGDATGWSYPFTLRPSSPFVTDPEVDENRLVLRFEASTPIWQWLRADIVTMATLPSHRNGQWGALPAHLSESTRATIATLSFHESVGRHVDVYGRFGMLRTDTRVIAQPRVAGGATLYVRDTETEPWLGLGLRYRVDEGPTLSAEYGGSTDGLRSVRLGFGWTF